MSAVRAWRQRPRDDAAVEVPTYLTHLDEFGSGRSFFSGFLLSAVNPKNLLLLLAGAAVVNEATESVSSQVTAWLVFTVIAGMSVAVPTTVYFLFGEQAESTLQGWKDWLIKNNVIVLIVILFIIGTWLIERGWKILVAS